MSDSDKNTILIVDDEAANITALTHILCHKYTLYEATNGQTALEQAVEHCPDLILLDAMMPEMDGYEVLSRLKSTVETRQIPVILITGLTNSQDEEKGIAMGAADYIRKPFRSAIVKLRVRHQIQIVNQTNVIRHLSITDPLTRVSNRGNFDHRLILEWNHARRDRTPLSLFLIDIDNFRPYNDMHGHLQGDMALQVVANSIVQSLNRSTDFVARWGGEEFAVLLPNTGDAGAREIAELIRKNIEDAPIPCSDDTAMNVTVSVGINTHVPSQGDSLEDFFSGATKALYTAKKSGKNRVCCFNANISA